MTAVDWLAYFLAHLGGASKHRQNPGVQTATRSERPDRGVMQVSDGWPQVMLRSQMIHAGTRSYAHSMAALV